MQSEQQQRIMGYFIEEAKDHLNTIEQGLLSLQSTMEDREMLNEVFRAAHSVKGGAAMLGISSIQKTAHRLEDCIKVLQESPVKVDAQLESLFLRVFDTLQALIEQLQSPFGLTDDAANEIMSDAEPVLEELNTYLEKLVEKAERSAVATAQAPEVALANSQVNTGSSKTLPASFKRDVLVELREMLQLFKQQDSPEHREALQEHCRQVARVGEELDLPGWSELLESARAAIAYPSNSYRQLANLVIKEIKQAEELALAGRSVEIAPSEQLKALVPEPPVSRVSEAADALEPEFDLTFDDDFDSEAREFETVAGDGYRLQDESESPLINLFDSPETEVQEDFQDEWNEQDFILDNTEDIYPRQTPIQLEERASAASRFADSAAGATPGANLSEPEVGMAELNTLADIFEGQTPDLDQTWQEEEIISLDDRELASDSEELFNLDDQNDFSDLVGDLDGLDIEAGSASLGTPEASASTSDDDLIDWLGDESTDSTTIALPGASESALYSQEQTDSEWSALESEAPLALTSNVTDDFADLLFEDDSSDRLLDSSTPPDELSSLLGDSFFEEDSPLEQNLEEFGFDADATEQVQQQEDEVLAMPVTDVFEEAPLDFSTSTDTSMEGEDFFNESFTSSGSDFLAFEDSSQEREDTDSDESWLEVSASAPYTQDALAASEMDFSDLLEISDSVSAAAPDSEAIALPGSSSAAVAKPGVSAAEDLGLGEELGIGDEATDLHFEELVFDESAADFDFAANENLTGYEWEDSSVAERPQVSEPSALSLEGNFLDTSTQDISDIESLTDLNFDLDATSTSPFNFDAQTSGDMDDLFENEALSPSEPSHSAAFESLEGFDDLLDTPTASAPAVEDLDFSAFEEPETIPDFDTLNAFFDTEEAIESDAFGVATTAETADDIEIEFEEFSIFEMPTAIDDFESQGVASPQASVLEEEALDEQLFEPSAIGAEGVADFSDSLWDTDEGALFEVGAEEASQADDSAAIENPPASDLEALLGDEIPGETDSAATVLPEALAFDSFEENLFEASPREQELADEEATANFLNLDWEGADAVEAENLEDFLSAELEAPSVADATLPEVEDVGAAEDETAAALDFDWETQESDSLRDSYSYPSGERYPSGSPLEYVNTSDLFSDVPQEVAASSPQAYEFDDLEAMLADGTATALPGASSIAASSPQIDEFADLEAMLDVAPLATDASEAADTELSFNDLEALLGEQMPATAEPSPVAATRAAPAKTKDEFSDLESLLEQAEKTMGGPPSVRSDQPSARPAIRPRSRIIEQTMRVPVKHLDSLSNLVGELVVNRNTLEQDQERLRQFLDNLSHQVLALSDVGSRMQDLYERSLLESSLLASRHGYRSSAHSDRSSYHQHSSGVEYDPLEMDRFTGFHLLSQEMIELIVRVRESASDIEFLVDETDQVARMLRQITTQLQEGLTRSRMVPFAQNADRLRRAVHEVCRKLGKEAKLIVEGGETLIDKMILEHLYDPMTHLVNNALTHGIERPEVRKAARKPAAGQIVLRAFHQGNQTVISISDDGAGINPETVRAKAVEKKLYTRTEAKNLTNAQLYDCLFHAGFSTKDKADDFAGRGVGMDVVRTSLSEIRGSIHIDSSVGKGTTFTIRLPLTLSICKALCCLNDKASIAFPMDGVEDMLDVPGDRVQTNSEGKTCIQWRDTQLCFQPLSELLKYKRQINRSTVYGGKREDDTISIVVLRSAGNFLAIQVDRVLGEQEIVIKQLEGPPPKPVGIAGATVLGDGRIMAIADVMELIDLSRGIRPDAGVTIWPREETHVEVPQETPQTKTEPMVLIVDDSITVRELLSMTFSKSGYRVEQARDGQEAWDKLRSGLPCDIVFCDIEMPRMDGLELLSRLQKDENLCHLPIAMLTSRGADRHRQMASQLGASGYFTKPYLEEVLLDAAQRMIKGEVLFSSSNA